MAEEIINQAGPLPIEAKVQTGSTGPASLAVAGSAWSETKNAMLGVDVEFDGTVVGTAKIFSNGTKTHRALVSMHFAVELDKPFTGDPPTEPPVYTVILKPTNGETITDFNDWFQVVLNF
ncbi:MAG: hypothetical protein HKN44_05965 [Ilumatobacter sp.]|nr:hypothetical protein [Ilumatobacter sp.]